MPFWHTTAWTGSLRTLLACLQHAALSLKVLFA